MTLPFLSCKHPDLLLQVYVQPGAKSTQWSGLYGDAVKIRLSAPPVDGKANLALCVFIAQTLNLPNRSVSVVRGLTSRNKCVVLQGAAEHHAHISHILSQIGLN